MTKSYITVPTQHAMNHTVPGHQLCYTEWGGDNSKVIFCVHGLTRNKHEFDYIAKSLSSEYRVIALDVVGRGESEWLADKTLYNYHTYVADCIYVIKALNLSPVLWFGSSMGGIIGMIVAAQHPEIISHLMLNDIGPQICGKSLSKIAKYVGLNPIFNDLKQLYNHCKVMYGASNITVEEHWQHIVKTTASSSGHSGQYKLHYDPQISVVIKNERSESTEDVHLWNVWKKIKQPICVLWGFESKLLRPDVAMQIQEQKNLSLYTINGVGHTPSLMDNEQIDIIYSWINQQF